MHAREKSRPLDLLGKTDAGEPYVDEESNFGDSGIRGGGVPSSVCGICRERPEMGKLGLRGVVGLVTDIDISSLEVRGGSRRAGEGDSDGGLDASDRDRILEGD